MSSPRDTIVAIATGAAGSPIGIIRVSGEACLQIWQRYFFSSQTKNEAKAPMPRFFHHGHLKDADGNLLDECLAVFFQAPNSFTGEDVVEFHCHGNPINLARIVQTILTHNSNFFTRAAGPGEFSQRAFLNGKLDLTQAEALHSLISADSEAAARGALENLDGALKRLVTDIHTQLRETLSLIEASFEFPEEDIQTFDRDELLQRLKTLQDRLTSLRGAYETSKLAENGVAVAIVGEPNVGKSSLLNALLIEERAIVSPQAGTTRDVIEGARFIDGVKFVFRDTAGLCSTPDEIEKQGIAKAKEWIERSQIILFVCDRPEQLKGLAAIPQLPHQVLIPILNKSDLLPATNTPRNFSVLTSAKTGSGLAELLKQLQNFLNLQNSVQNKLQVSARQFQKVQVASDHINDTITALSATPPIAEVACEEIRLAMASLEEIVGIITNDEVLGEIFSRFCIGK